MSPSIQHLKHLGGPFRRGQLFHALRKRGMGGSRVEGSMVEESTKQSACDCFCVGGGETVELGP